MAAYPYHRVLWSEGLFISPQHFQQTDHFHESTLDFRLRPLIPYPWGLLDVQVDQRQLETSGIFTLTACRGVFPGGATVNIPAGDAGLASREVPPQLFAATSDHLDVYLALPVEQPNTRNYGPADGAADLPDTRYVAEYARVVDESNGKNERDIMTARKNFKTLFGGESSDDMERLKIAELVRGRDGRIALNAAYIPPCLVLAASPRLLAILDELIGALTSKATDVLGARHQRSPDRYEFRQDPEALWLLGVLDTFIPLLLHIRHVQQVHPEALYRGLVQLAGQLSVLAVRMRATDVPSYDHDNLSASFGQLHRMILTLLEIATGPGLVQAASWELVEATSPAGYPIWRTTSSLDERLVTAEGDYYLVVAASTVDPNRQDSVDQMIPDLATIASVQDIDSYIELAYGLHLTATAPPAEIPPRPGAAYFTLDRVGAAWDSIRAGRTLALYIPREFRREFTRFAVELLVIQGDSSSAA